MKLQVLKKPVLVLLLSTIMLSCNVIKTTIYDQHSYQESISLKVEANHLMNSASESYTEHQTEVEAYQLALEKLIEYEKNKENNELSYAMVTLIGNPDKNLLGGFFKRWKAKDKLSKFFVDEAKTQVTEAFDVLIRYESRKDKKEITNYLSK